MLLFKKEQIHRLLKMASGLVSEARLRQRLPKAIALCTATCLNSVRPAKTLVLAMPPSARALHRWNQHPHALAKAGKKMPPCGAAAAWFRKVLWRSDGAVFVLAVRLPLPRGQACHTKARQQ